MKKVIEEVRVKTIRWNDGDVEHEITAIRVPDEFANKKVRVTIEAMEKAE